jgi:Xaa-Pro aminopeptidase
MASDVLIFADSVTSPEMRHEVPVLVPDPFLYIEKDGKQITASTSFEVERIAEAGIEAHAWEAFGYDELLEQGVSREQVTWHHINLNACREFGVEDAIIPRTFPVYVADHLRANGITLTPDPKFFSDRRRVKNEAEIAGIRRAQRAAEAGMGAATEILARAEPSNGSVTVDGEPLTSEMLKGAIRRAFTEHGVSSEDFIVSHGAQTAIGHELGFGEIAANEPVVIDLWPKDPESACYADMTRTYVVGTPPDELVEYHRLVKEALDRSLEATKPGVPGIDVYKLVCELFEENGQKTVLQTARCSRTASSTGSATASASRCTRLRTWGEAARLSSSRVTLSRWSRASTARASAAAGSRTSCSSPRTAPRTSRTSRTT